MSQQEKSPTTSDAPDPRESVANRGLKVHGVNAVPWVRLARSARKALEVPKGHRAFQLKALSVRPGLGASQDRRGLKGIGGQLDHAVSTAMSGLAVRGGLLVKWDLVVLQESRVRQALLDLEDWKDQQDQEV